MPELPEVETIRRGLASLMAGATVASVQVHESPKSFPNDATTVREFLIGATVTAVRRRAKVLLIELETAYTLMIHLKMTGQLVWVGRERFGAGHPTESLIGALPDRSTRVSVAFEDGSHLYFNDQRKFGWMKLYPTAEVPTVDFMRRVGPEPLDDALTPEVFLARIRRRANTTIKAALLDQSIIAGIGNIYADESLWAARIHPATRVRSVGDEQLTRLLDEIKYVLQLAIDKGGSTDRNYVNAEGKKGSYIDFARVFRREGQPCRRHPEVLIEKSKVASRGTHTCPVCQPITLPQSQRVV